MSRRDWKGKGGSLYSRLACVVLGAALGLSGGFAPVFFGTISVFLKPISQEFGWGRAETSGAAVFSMVGLAIGAVCTGRLIDKVGAKFTIYASVVAMSALVALMASIGGDPKILTVLSFAIGLFGAGTTPPGYLSVLTLRFDKNLGFALGLAGIGMGVGTIVMPIVATYLIAAYGWRTAYVGLAGISLLTGLLACQILFMKSEHAQKTTQPFENEKKRGDGAHLREALVTKELWILLVVIVAVAVSSLGISVHFVAMLTDKAIDMQQAARAAALSGVGVVIGRILCGYLLDRFHAPHIASGAFLLAAAGAICLAYGGRENFVVASLSGIFIGFALGAEGDFLPYFVRKYFGIKAFGSVYGVLFFAHGIGGVIGPVLFGAAFDRIGSYTPALLGGAIALGMAMVLVNMLGKYKFPE